MGLLALSMTRLAATGKSMARLWTGQNYVGRFRIKYSSVLNSLSRCSARVRIWPIDVSHCRS
jgi:hypothetical protein